MLCVATATFLSSSKERNTLDFPTMRNGTLKLQDETIDLPYDPLEIAIVVAPTFP